MKPITEGRHTGSEPISPKLLKQLAYNDRMAELGHVSAGMVHELNAPLSLIISASQMIMREEEVSDFVREMVGRISDEALRLSQLTKGLLGFSAQDDRVGEVDINLTVEFVLDFIRYEASRRGVSVLRSLDHRLPQVRLSGNQLKQVLLNLVMNALQAMEESGGRMAVETGLTPQGEIRILVVDTGPGIAADSLHTIFEPYFTTKEDGKGTGLGLFITRNLVEGMGGRITVSSPPGQGASFSITLPVEE